MRLLVAPDKSRRPSKSSKLSDAPMALAGAYERFLRPTLSGPGGEKFIPQVLYHYRDEYYWWDGTTYRAVPRKRIHNALYRFLDGLDLVGVGRGNYKCQPDVNLIRKVLDALDGVCECGAETIPSWLDDSKVSPENVLAFKNGLLDVGRYLADGEDTLLPPTPNWFSTTVLPHAFVAKAECPRWVKFLNEVFAGDADQIALLQEWYGYCLGGDTRFQKLMFVVGRPGSGKSTALGVLGKMIGQDNCASPTLRKLGGRFGLHSLMDKRVAICGDAHLGKSADPMGVLETLKMITGRDPVDVERKGKDDITNVKLGVRFTIAVNEIPYLPDASGALMRRLLVVRFNQNFVGREDRSLDDQLETELPGIMLWALEGLGRLRENQAFTESKVSTEALEEIARTNAPVYAFVDDECIRPANAAEHGKDPETLSATSDEIWERWKKWAEENNCMKDMNRATFGKKLLGIEGVEKRRLGSRGDRSWTYTGLALQLRMSELPY